MFLFVWGVLIVCVSQIHFKSACTQLGSHMVHVCFPGAHVHVYHTSWNNDNAQTVVFHTGHAFAGGAVTTMCNDYRVMLTDKGWWSMNEIFLGIHRSCLLRT